MPVRIRAGVEASRNSRTGNGPAGNEVNAPEMAGSLNPRLSSPPVTDGSAARLDDATPAGGETGKAGRNDPDLAVFQIR